MTLRHRLGRSLIVSGYLLVAVAILLIAAASLLSLAQTPKGTRPPPEPIPTLAKLVNRSEWPVLVAGVVSAVLVSNGLARIKRRRVLGAALLIAGLAVPSALLLDFVADRVISRDVLPTGAPRLTHRLLEPATGPLGTRDFPVYATGVLAILLLSVAYAHTYRVPRLAAAVRWLGRGLGAAAVFGIVTRDDGKYAQTALDILQHSGFVLGVATGLAAPAVIAAGRRCLVPTAEELRARDQRPPILVLRSFRDDGRPLRRDPTFVGLLGSLVPSFTGRGRVAFEGLLADRLRILGPAVAIGRPGELLAPMGAARHYVRGDWQSEVTDLMRESRLVVMILNSTEGLLWEVRRMAELGLLEKLVILFPPAEGEEMAEHWQHWLAGQLKGVALPPQLTGHPLLLTFSDGGKQCRLWSGIMHTDLEYAAALDRLRREVWAREPADTLPEPAESSGSPFAGFSTDKSEPLHRINAANMHGASRLHRAALMRVSVYWYLFAFVLAAVGFAAGAISGSLAYQLTKPNPNESRVAAPDAWHAGLLRAEWLGGMAGVWLGITAGLIAPISRARQEVRCALRTTDRSYSLPDPDAAAAAAQEEASLKFF